MIIIPPEEVDEFLANESGTLFTDEQLTFFRRAKKSIANSEKEDYFKYVLIAITTYTRGVYMVLEVNFDENKSE